jgi:uncharacterized membrane protein
MTLGRAVGLSVAGLMILAGGVFAGQGMGYIDGSPMTGQDEWAFIGSALAGLGVALVIVVVQNARRRDG